MTQETLLSVHNLSHSFDEHKAIDNINFNIHRGEVVALLGVNGAGKSTTLNIITGNLSPQEGNVSICAENIFTQPKKAKLNLGYLPDTPPVYKELTVSEFLTFAARIHAVEKNQIKTCLTEALEICDLTSVSHKLIANLSKGYKQRVGIAQAIIHKPALVILDEPTVGLDPIQMQDIRALLNELSKNHSVLLSTHLLSEAESTCNRVMIIDQGCLLLDQTLNKLNQGHQQSTKRVKLRFSGEPSVEALNSIPGCESVSCSQYGMYVCSYSDADFIQQLQSRALENQWQLYEISPVGASLEQSFMDLVVKDSA